MTTHKFPLILTISLRTPNTSIGVICLSQYLQHLLWTSGHFTLTFWPSKTFHHRNAIATTAAPLLCKYCAIPACTGTVPRPNGTNDRPVSCAGKRKLPQLPCRICKVLDTWQLDYHDNHPTYNWKSISSIHMRDSQLYKQEFGSRLTATTYAAAKHMLLCQPGLLFANNSLTLRFKSWLISGNYINKWLW